MATTPRHGWTTPDDTDPIKDGAAAIRTLANAIDGDALGLRDRLFFTADTTFDKANYPAGRHVLVRLQAGGGASGGSVGTATGQASAGGGGGGGGYVEVWLPFSALAASEPVIVGAGGARGAAAGDPGGDGGDSRFGPSASPHAIAYGGAGGVGGVAYSTPSSGPGGGSGGNGSGDLVISGGNGVPLSLFESRVGRAPAAGSHLSPIHGGGATNGFADGAQGRSYGGGAQPGFSTEGQSGTIGADGGGGIVIIDVYG